MYMYYRHLVLTLFARVPFSVMSPKHRGSFRKIVKRKRKLTVKKLCWEVGGGGGGGGASLVLFSHIMQVPANMDTC